MDGQGPSSRYIVKNATDQHQPADEFLCQLLGHAASMEEKLITTADKRWRSHRCFGLKIKQRRFCLCGQPIPIPRDAGEQEQSHVRLRYNINAPQESRPWVKDNVHDLGHWFAAMGDRGQFAFADTSMKDYDVPKKCKCGRGGGRCQVRQKYYLTAVENVLVVQIARAFHADERSVRVDEGRVTIPLTVKIHGKLYDAVSWVEHKHAHYTAMRWMRHMDGVKRWWRINCKAPMPDQITRIHDVRKKNQHVTHIVYKRISGANDMPPGAHCMVVPDANSSASQSNRSAKRKHTGRIPDAHMSVTSDINQSLRVTNLLDSVFAMCVCVAVENEHTIKSAGHTIAGS